MKIVIWSVTECCNLRCAGCMARSKNKFFSVDTLDDFIKELKCNKVKIVSITGGEPTLHPKILEIVKRLKDVGIWVHIATNGSRPEVLDKLCDYIDAASVSLDSDNEIEHNTYRGVNIYNKVLESIAILRGRIKVLTANMLVASFNYNKVGKIAEFVNERLGVPLSICYPEFDGYLYRPFDINKEQLRTAFEYAYLNYENHIFGNMKSYYLDVIKYLRGEGTHPCRAGQFIFYVDSELNVRPCFRRDEILNSSLKWKEDRKDCNECMIECFREPSINKRLEQLRLIFRLWKYTHRRLGGGHIENGNNIYHFSYKRYS